tara:strand:+ start:17140 stop:18222 length:1083 start_codon:yes stop_codon:yes gene_type:complete
MNQNLNKLLCIILIVYSCDFNNVNDPFINQNSSSIISGVDISDYPKVLSFNPTFYNINNNEVNFINSLIENGVNTVRLRLWVNPANESSSLEEVKEFSDELKSLGFKIWITPHFSDTWAHPGQQQIPSDWVSLNFQELKNQVYIYTSHIMNVLDPDYIQIGNEINTGILFPHGKISENQEQFLELVNEGVSAVRNSSTDTKIILHCAGFESSSWFFNIVNHVDYDIIGVSYYPWHHGKSLNDLQDQLSSLSSNFEKEILIAETSYPFTLGWNDWTNNNVGLEEHLILPEYPASPVGQKDFIRDVKNLILEVNNGIGFCYWGAERIAWAGENSTNGSSWENQAVFDFDNRELPVLEEFNLN